MSLGVVDGMHRGSRRDTVKIRQVRMNLASGPRPGRQSRHAGRQARREEGGSGLVL